MLSSLSKKLIFIKSIIVWKWNHKEKNKSFLWIYAQHLSGHLWFNGQQKSLVSGLHWNPWGITLVDVLQNWLNWFHFLFLEVGQLVIVIDCMIFSSPFLDVTRASMSTVSFPAQLDCGILCL